MSWPAVKHGPARQTRYVASPTADTGVLAVSQLPLVDRRPLNSIAEPAGALHRYLGIFEFLIILSSLHTNTRHISLQ
jgi:hypothetical protein